MIESYPYEDYVRQRNWGKACECVESYISIYRCQRARRAWITNFFCFALAVVEAFVTWVLLYPSADEKELAAFPLTTLCHTFYTKLCQNVPGGEVVVIGGLIVIMFLLCLLGILISLTIRPQKPATTTCHTPQTLNGRLKVLKEYYGGMLSVGATTFWETELGEADFDGAGSLCHAWSAAPVFLLPMLQQ